MDVTRIATKLDLVRKHRILFSHHSVGRDLISGLGRAARKTDSKPLPVLSLEQAQANPTAPGLVSISGGRNQDPQSKLDFFAETLRTTTYKPELAFLKLCYVDFNPHTDVDALFAAYQKTIDALKREHPHIQFAHVTTPLVARPAGIKDRIYRMIGREVWEDAANVKRYQFNQKLLGTYAGDPVFDLARVESTLPDGSRASFEAGGHTYFTLASQYTDDGGHLNDRGQDVAAAEWVHFLASALERGSTH